MGYNNPRIKTEDLVRLYKQGYSSVEISKKIGMDGSAILRRLRREGFTTRTIGEGIRLAHKLGKVKIYHGKENYAWKGGKYLRDGYVWIRAYPSDRFFCMAQQNHFIAEHRLVMAKHLGRPLKSWETVHHKNGVKSDNRIKNLKILKKYKHDGITVLEEKIKRLERENEMLRFKLKQKEG